MESLIYMTLLSLSFILVGCAMPIPPEISSLMPTSGPEGTVLTINGFNFNNPDSVQFQEQTGDMEIISVPANAFTSTNSNQIVLSVPFIGFLDPPPGDINVRVVTNTGVSLPAVFTYTM